MKWERIPHGKEDGKTLMGLPSWRSGEESACNAGDTGSITGWGRPPGEGNGNALQDSCLENPVDRGAWWATVHGVAKSRTRLERLNKIKTLTDLLCCGTSVASDLSCLCLEKLRAPGHSSVSGTSEAEGYWVTLQLCQIRSLLRLLHAFQKCPKSFWESPYGCYWFPVAT